MFTPYYILAVGFGVLATLISFYSFVVKKDDPSFPGKLSGPIMIGAAILGIATFGFVWKGGEEELDHKKHEEEQQLEEGHSENTDAPTGVKYGN